MIVDESRALPGKGRIANRCTLAWASLGMTLTLLFAEPVAAQSLYRIGFLGLSSPADYASSLQAFHDGLRELGYEQGKNISIEYRWANGRDERLPALAAELVHLNPDVFVTHSALGTRAAQQATTTIPIVMGVISDPVRLGVVKSLARPGGNTTGVATLQIDLSAKRLELFKEAVPTLRRVAVLLNARNPGVREDLRQLKLASAKLGVQLHTVDLAREPQGLEAVFAVILRDRPDGLIVVADPVASAHSARIAAFAVTNRLPSMAGTRNFVASGGLISYTGDFSEAWRVAARYVDRILKGAKPAELPIEQLSRFYLTINLKSAKALGLTIPPAILVRADEVLE